VEAAQQPIWQFSSSVLEDEGSLTGDLPNLQSKGTFACAASTCHPQMNVVHSRNLLAIHGELCPEMVAACADEATHALYPLNQ